MLKLFTKKQFFAFLASFFITIVLGFFVWNLFLGSNSYVFIFNKVLGQVSKTNSNFFSASLSSLEIQPVMQPAAPSNDGANLIPETNSDQDLSPRATGEEKPAFIPPELDSGEAKQDLLDDIAEKLDILAIEIQNLQNQQNLEVKTQDQSLSDKTNKDDQNKQDDQNHDNNKNNQVKDNINKNSGSVAIYPKILISEVQIAGSADEKQEFIELYNLNNQDVDLTNWYLQRKTAGSGVPSGSWLTYASNNLFSGKIIPANSYFLIARVGYYSGQADIFTDNSITDDNSFALKNPNGEISDKLGFGNAEDPELLATVNPAAGQSIGRKVLLDGTEEEQNNNLNDFEIQTPTPKAQNKTYVATMSNGGGGGGSASVVYLKILISEVQISPIAQRFVELYNPNNADVNLTNWYIQRKTQTSDSWNSFVSSPKFEGKIIPANGYFLISRQIENSDILLDITLSENNSLALKNPGGEISDNLGFGDAKNLETVSAQNPTDSKSIGRKWDLANNIEQDTDNNLEDFELEAPTPKEKNIKWVEPAPTDITTPTVNFSLDPTQNSLAFAINFTIIDPFDTVTPSGINSYIFHWKEENAEWQEDSSQNFSGNPVKRDFVGEDQKTYYFQIKAKDLAGNESDWLPTEPVFTKIEILKPVEAKPILINEIQIDGIDGTGGTNDDWIELYNPNDFEIFLNNYNGSYLRLVKRSKTSASDTTIKSWSSDPDAKIPAKGFYLWVSSTDSNYPLLVQADSSTKQNISSDNGVALRSGPEDTGEIIDAVGWGEFNNVLFEGVSAQNPPGGKSIKRKNLGEDTNDNSQDFVISNMPTPKGE